MSAYPSVQPDVLSVHSYICHYVHTFFGMLIPILRLLLAFFNVSCSNTHPNLLGTLTYLSCCSLKLFHYCSRPIPAYWQFSIHLSAYFQMFFLSFLQCLKFINISSKHIKSLCTRFYISLHIALSVLDNKVKLGMVRVQNILFPHPVPLSIPCKPKLFIVFSTPLVNLPFVKQSLHLL